MAAFKAALDRLSGAYALAVMIAHARDAAPPPSSLRPDVPADLDAVARKLLARDPESPRPLFATLNEHLATAQELAAEYANAGLWTDAALLLGEAVKTSGPAAASPIIHYYLGDFAEKLGQDDQAALHRRNAATKSRRPATPEYL